MSDNRNYFTIQTKKSMDRFEPSNLNITSFNPNKTIEQDDAQIRGIKAAIRRKK